MNVRELIEALQECDPEMDVEMVDACGHAPVDRDWLIVHASQVSRNGREWVQLR